MSITERRGCGRTAGGRKSACFTPRPQPHAKDTLMLLNKSEVDIALRLQEEGGRARQSSRTLCVHRLHLNRGAESGCGGLWKMPRLSLDRATDCFNALICATDKHKTEQLSCGGAGAPSPSSSRAKRSLPSKVKRINLQFSNILQREEWRERGRGAHMSGNGEQGGVCTMSTTRHKCFITKAIRFVCFFHADFDSREFI